MPGGIRYYPFAVEVSPRPALTRFEKHQPLAATAQTGARNNIPTGREHSDLFDFQIRGFGGIADSADFHSFQGLA
ncbi:MAG: hypothetical protein EOR81_32865 [Mesorhizobium sp.]|nr:MAG: hypothetical protein EOR81_32865 [Mesorhizobium sp.]